MKVFHIGKSNPRVLLVVKCAVLVAIFCGSARAQSICGTQPALSINNNTFHVQNNEFGSTASECINVNGTISM
jgi:hypothetical protein